MTTLVYEGATKTLYADSMVTTKVAGACTRVDMTYKVEDLSRLDLVSCQGERIIAMAFSGSVMVFNRIAKFILNNLHCWNDAVNQLVDHGVRFDDFNNCSTMLFTDKFAYCFRFLPGEVEVETVDLDENIVAGSGAAFAKVALEVYGADGFDAIAAAAMCDPDTGCLVHAYQIRENALVSQEPVLFLDNQEVRKAMRERAATSNRNMKVANLFSRVPENILIRLDADSPFVQRIRKENLDQYRASQQSDSSKED